MVINSRSVNGSIKLLSVSLRSPFPVPSMHASFDFSISRYLDPSFWISRVKSSRVKGSRVSRAIQSVPLSSGQVPLCTVCTLNTVQYCIVLRARSSLDLTCVSLPTGTAVDLTRRQNRDRGCTSLDVLESFFAAKLHDDAIHSVYRVSLFEISF